MLISSELWYVALQPKVFLTFSGKVILRRFKAGFERYSVKSLAKMPILHSVPSI